jgi:hypothetical protein
MNEGESQRPNHRVAIPQGDESGQLRHVFRSQGQTRVHVSEVLSVLLEGSKPDRRTGVHRTRDQREVGRRAHEPRLDVRRIASHLQNLDDPTFRPRQEATRGADRVDAATEAHVADLSRSPDPREVRGCLLHLFELACTVGLARSARSDSVALPMISATTTNVLTYTTSPNPGTWSAARSLESKVSMIAPIESALAKIPGPRPPYHALIATGVTKSRFVRRWVALSTLSATSSASVVTTTATP